MLTHTPSHTLSHTHARSHVCTITRVPRSAVTAYLGVAPCSGPAPALCWGPAGACLVVLSACAQHLPQCRARCGSCSPAGVQPCAPSFLAPPSLSPALSLPPHPPPPSKANQTAPRNVFHLHLAPTQQARAHDRLQGRLRGRRLGARFTAVLGLPCEAMAHALQRTRGQRGWRAAGPRLRDLCQAAAGGLGEAGAGAPGPAATTGP